MEKNTYENPLITRYTSKEMSHIFSPNFKFGTWRKLWIALAESEAELGLPITKEQLDELKSNQMPIDYELAAAKEKEVRHDVMAHVHTYGESCPKAKGIIHLGATSAYVGDNTDIIQLKTALELIRIKMVNLLSIMSKFALKNKSLATLGFTHFQPAQLTTVGKRTTLWMHELYLDFEQLEFAIETLKMRGVKGTTGTQASYLKLFDGDHEKVKCLDEKVAQKMGFKNSYPISGQTYSRKVDGFALNVLSGIAQSLHKTTNDIRLLQSLKEVEEPFEKSQIGSSAMAYKRNPMRSERISSLSKFIMSNALNPALIASTQWFERTLDDSANRRLSVAQCFMATDAILEIAINVFDGMVVYENVIKKHVLDELPFMMTENILMEAVKKGGDRQYLHEVIRELSMEAGKVVKVDGKPNDLLDRIIASDDFNLSQKDLNEILDLDDYIGRSPEQVEEFITDFINPILESYKNDIGLTVDLKV